MGGEQALRHDREPDRFGRPSLTEVDGSYALTTGDESEHHFPPDPLAAAVRTKTLSAICRSICLASFT
ncbi:hypothetical protein IQ62_26725 [Streptomyces scabiei]|nr:hypothetical protein IQ62_26725 [Streptomyces scabiei]